jgi:pyruvate,orthophosphate dikinase
MAKWVYSFGNGTAEGRAEMRNLLGGKGANLAEMSSLGLPVPPGFTVTTELCTYYYANNESYPPELKDEVEAALASVEKTVGAGFGDAGNPLLVSVRSGARASMPGIEARAPERTETSSGLLASPNRAPTIFSTTPSAFSTSSLSSGG